MKAVLLKTNGGEVWCNVKMDNLLEKECLCLNCDLMEHCGWAVEFYNMCKDANIALAVTRCPEWRKR